MQRRNCFRVRNCWFHCRVLLTAPVMWSETVSLRTRPVSDQKLVLVLYTAVLVCLAGLVLCCETRSCHARRHNLEGHSNFLSTICSFCILCLEHHYCRDQHSLHLKAFTYLKVKSAKCLCLLPVVLILVLRICSCLHHWIAKRSSRAQRDLHWANLGSNAAGTHMSYWWWQEGHPVILDAVHQ